MGNRKIRLNDKNTMQKVQVNNDSISADEFFKLHEDFIKDKTLEGLASITLEEHKNHMRFFKNYLKSATQSEIDYVVIKEDILKGYIYYMTQEKQYSPFTINIRLRTMRCYLKWLYEQGYLHSNYALKLKLQKTPTDAVTLLTDDEIKKVLKACDLNNYVGYRDFTLILLILDCGIRIGEATEIKVEDIDLKNRIVNVNARVSKTREHRQLPISQKTCKLLKDLIEIAHQMESDYVFQSTYGGQIKKQNIILSFNRLGKKAGIKKRCTPYVLGIYLLLMLLGAITWIYSHCNA